MSSFAALKKKSQGAFNALSAKVEEEKGGRYKDDRFWTLTVDKAGTGMATIRFLPAVDGEEVPYVKRYEYFIKNGNRWYINYCRSTLKQPDPVNEYFFELRGDGSDKIAVAKARKFGRSTNYIANIYVVDDPANPDNNGKVFLFKFGSRIFQRLESAIKPEFSDEEPFNPFDFWEGANFKLKAKNVDGMRSYDSSAFAERGPLADDETMEKIWGQQYPLLPEIAPEKFKSYDQLKKEFDAFMSNAPKGKAKDVDGESNEDDEPSFASSKRPDEVTAERRSAKQKPVEEEFDDVPFDGGDNDEDEFEKYRAMLED